MYELKKNGKVFTSKLVGTGPSSYGKRIYWAAVSQRLRNPVLDDACPERTVKEGQTRRHILTYCNASPSIKSDRWPVQSFQMLHDPRTFVISCFLALRRDDVSNLSHIAKFCPLRVLKFYLFGSSYPLYFIFLFRRSVPHKTVRKRKLLWVFF